MTRRPLLALALIAAALVVIGRRRAEPKSAPTIELNIEGRKIVGELRPPTPAERRSIRRAKEVMRGLGTRA